MQRTCQKPRSILLEFWFRSCTNAQALLRTSQLRTNYLISNHIVVLAAACYEHVCFLHRCCLMRSVHFSLCAGFLLSGTQLACKQSAVSLYYPALALVNPQDWLNRRCQSWTQLANLAVQSSLGQAADTRPCRTLRQYSSLSTNLAGSRGESPACTLGADSTVDDAAASLQAFTQQIHQKSSRHILAVAKHVAEWRRDHEGVSHASGAARIQLAVANFAQQAAALLLLRKQRRREVSILGTVEALRASTGLAEIFHAPQCPALPFAARQTAGSQSGSTPAACLQVLSYITILQDILERQMSTAGSSISSTQILTALRAAMQALNAVAAAAGTPQPEASKQIDKCTLLSRHDCHVVMKCWLGLVDSPVM